MANRSDGRVSIKEISKYAGVSIATVSRVINGMGKCSQETERKVWEVIREHNYFANTAARSLRTSHNPNIGLLLPDLTNELFAKITVSIERQLFARGYSSVIYNAPGSGSYQERYRSLTDAHNVAGIISLFSHEFDTQEPPENTPIVFLGLSPSESQLQNRSYVFIRSDYRARSHEAARELLDKGCRRLLYIMQNHFGQNADYAFRSQRYLGFLDALREKGMAEDDFLRCMVNDSTVETAYEAALNMLTEHPDIDGALCNSAQSGVGVTYAARGLHKRVPDDLKVSSFDDTTLSRFYSPQITSVFIDGEQYASLAVQNMIDLVERREPPQRNYLVDSYLIQRESTRSAISSKEEALS